MNICGFIMVSEELTAQNFQTLIKGGGEGLDFFYLLHFLHFLHICG